jgi:hypothetical protein
LEAPYGTDKSRRKIYRIQERRIFIGPLDFPVPADELPPAIDPDFDLPDQEEN